MAGRRDIAKKGSEKIKGVDKKRSVSDVIRKASELPAVRVGRRDFLMRQFGDCERLDVILEHGPQYVYDAAALSKFADSVIWTGTGVTAVSSFLSGIPSGILLAGPAGWADMLQFYGVAINLALKIGYIFGEEDLGDLKSELAGAKVTAMLGVMLGVSDADKVLERLCSGEGDEDSDDVKKIAVAIGRKLAKDKIFRSAEKAIPVAGAFLSCGMTLVAFRVLGRRLVKVYEEIVRKKQKS